MKNQVFTMSQLLVELKEKNYKDVTKRMVRYYVQRGLLDAPETKQGGARYDEDYLYRIIAIQKLLKLYKLSGVKEKLEGMNKDSIRELATRQEKVTDPMSKEEAEFKLGGGVLHPNVQPSLLITPVSPIVDYKPNPRHLVMAEYRTPMLSSFIIPKENVWQRFNLMDGVELSVRNDALARLERGAPSVAEEIENIFTRLSVQGGNNMASPKEYVFPESTSQWFECYRINGHLFAEFGEHRVLLDTGFPQSFGNCGTLSICGRDFQVPRELDFPTAVYSTEEFGKLIETTFDAFIGADVLKEFDFLIDLTRGTITFTNHIEYTGSNPIGLQPKDGLPIVLIHLDDQNHPFLIATGNKLSFLHTNLAQNYPVVGKGTDFLPRIWDFEGGKFETELRRVKFRLGKNNYILPFGQSPRQLEECLWKGLGVMGILGGDLLERYPVGFSLKRNLIF